MLECLAVRVLLTIIFLSCLPVLAAEKSKVNFLEEITIISADKLESTKQISILTGNIDIEFQDYRIKSPHARILANANGEFDLASFINGAVLESDGLKIIAEKIEINLTDNSINCYNNGSNLVETQILQKGEKNASLFSQYQQYDLITGAGHGEKDVHYVGKDLDITSTVVDMTSDENKKLNYINFQEKAIAIGEKERVEGEELIFFPAIDLLKANRQVKFQYIKDSESTYVFADYMVYEKAQKLLSAFSRSINDVNSLVRVYSDDSFGRSRQILLSLDDTDSVDKAILTGLAYSQNKDKSLVGHEIIFDLKNKTMESSVDRPKTLVLVKNKPEGKKRS